MLVLGPVLCVLCGAAIGWISGFAAGYSDAAHLARRALGRMPRSCLRHYGVPIPASFSAPPATEPSPHDLARPASPET